MKLSETSIKKLPHLIFYTSFSIVLTYLFFKYIFTCILPFAVAFLLAHSTRRIVLYMGNKLKFKRNFSVFVVTAIIIGVIFTLIYILFAKMLSELTALADHHTNKTVTTFISDILEGISELLNRYFPNISERITPAVTSIAKNIDTIISSTLQAVLPAAGKFFMDFFKSLPSVLLFAGVTLIAMFYFGCDYEIIVSFIKKQLSEKQTAFVKELKNQFFVTVINILRAYAILILMTFIQLWIGFAIIGIKYSTLLAFIISIIDILPVIGTGTVLVPWSAILFITGNLKTGLCILLLYVIITVIRQIAEPKILGQSVGLHPLVTLISMYFGIKLMGIKGLFLIPLAVIIAKNLNEKGFIHIYKNTD